MLKKVLLLPFVSLIVGSAIWLFMVTLEVTIQFFQTHWIWLLIGLPFVTLLYGYLEKFRNVQRFGHTELLFTEIRKPQVHVHWFLAPWIYLSTMVFHFFGASVGRESTAVQMGASLAESVGRLFKIPLEDRPILIRMGFAAGFGAAFGVPWAGAVFALESPLLFRKRDWWHFPFYVLSSWGAHLWATQIGLKHLIWQTLSLDFFEFGVIAYIRFTAILILLALVYEFWFRWARRKLLRWPWWIRSGMGGLAIVLLTLAVGAPTFNNLGTQLIQSAFEERATWSQALSKLGFTLISILSGMKGGEVTPLMASGALFGSFLAGQMSLFGFQTGAALGLVTLFCSRLRIAATGTVMLWEIFDWKIALLGAPILFLTEVGQRKWVSKFS